MAFRTFITLYKHHRYLTSEHFHHPPEETLHLRSNHFSFPPILWSLATTYLSSVFMDLHTGYFV